MTEAIFMHRGPKVLKRTPGTGLFFEQIGTRLLFCSFAIGFDRRVPPEIYSCHIMGLDYPYTNVDRSGG